MIAGMVMVMVDRDSQVLPSDAAEIVHLKVPYRQTKCYAVTTSISHSFIAVPCYQTCTNSKAAPHHCVYYVREYHMENFERKTFYLSVKRVAGIAITCSF